MIGRGVANSDRWFYGRIAAIFISDGELSSSDRFSVHTYFNNKYGTSLPTS